MRILMVSRGVVSIGKGSGGAEHVAYELARHLAERGDEVILVADVDAELLSQSPPTLSVVPVGRYRGIEWLTARVPLDFPRWVLQHLLGNIRAARRANQFLHSDPSGFDAVHSHGALATILLRRTVSAREGVMPLVYTEHDSTPWSCRYRRWSERVTRRCVYRQINLRACRAATVVVTNFPALADEISRRAGHPPVPLHDGRERDCGGQGDELSCRRQH